MLSARSRRRFRLALVAFWSCVLAWLGWNMQAHGVAPAVLQSDAAVTVSRQPAGRVFSPAVDTARAGLLFYPGALVEPDAYAPLARDVAAAGFEVVVLELPFRLAPLERHRAELFERTRALIESDPRGRRWVIGGHSKGGALAALFARDHAADVAGLLLVGTSHPRRDDLSGLALDVTKVYGSEDGLASEEEVHQFAPNLPGSTHWVRVDGGNHAQFGWYGWQLGDGRARLPREAQHAATTRAVVEQLGRVGGAPPR